MKTAASWVLSALIGVPCAAQGDRKPQDETAAPPHLAGEKNEQRSDAHRLSPQIHGDELLAAVHRAYRRGFDYLTVTQNADGSWGSHDPKMAFLKDFGFQTVNRGSQDGVRLGCTAIAGKALLRKAERTPSEQMALDRAILALLDTQKFAYHLGESFNTWGYGYKLDFLCDYLEVETDPRRRAAASAAAQVCINGLARFQQADGGWNYYAGPLNDGESMSFNTANFAENLFRARQLGLPVPKGMESDAFRLLKRCITAKGGVVYDARFLLDGGSVNELSAGARTAALTEALAEAGLFQDSDMLRSMHVFNEGENWLEHGRKLIQPHTAVHQVSGYFFFYGYHYLAEYLHRLGDKVPVERWERTAWTMVRTQEEYGGWWDTAAADYGDKWGTGFALMTLERCMEHWPSSNESPEPTTNEDPADDGGQGS